MKNYDIQLDREANDPLNIMLDNISSNSNILEFGCANGRMTNYLTNSMSCKVDIIEYDNELYSKAIKFANSGICDDIEKFEWVKKFQETKYDYIIFADILEHLKNPHRVLEECKKLLKPEGIIWISIPNIAHNDIIIQLIRDKFVYTETGILDKTHLHYFSYDNAKHCFQNLDYNILYEDGIYKQTFCTEQLLLDNLEMDPIYYELLDKKEGEIYQYVFALSLLEDNSDLKAENYKYFTKNRRICERRIYLDCGEGYNETIINNYDIAADFLDIEIKLPKDIKMVWICPAFKKMFSIENLEIYTNKGKIDYTKVEAENVDGILKFKSLPGSIYIGDIIDCEWLKITGKIKVGINFDKEESHNLMNDLNNEIDKNISLTNETNYLKLNLNNIQNEKNNLDDTISKLSNDIEILEKSIKDKIDLLSITGEKLKISEEDLEKTEIELKISEENLKSTENELKISEENLERTENELKISEENLERTENELKVYEDMLINKIINKI